MRSCIFILILLYAAHQCACKNPITRNIRPLIPKSDTSTIEKKNTLFAFVGEKIDVQPLPVAPGSMDGGFRAKYKILLPVYGSYSGETIEFTAYDHYGWPAFASFKNVLLFVSEYQGKYYHEKYQYFDVYKTKDGRWASPYKSEDYGHPFNKNTTIKPEVIEFAESVKYPLHFKRQDGSEYTVSYLAPYYVTKGDSAIAIYGNYVEDLFALKKTGVLAARGLFDMTEKQEEEMYPEVTLEDVKRPPDADDLKFMAFWKHFAASVKKPGLTQFQAIALDSLWICDTPLSANNFIRRCFTEVFDADVMKRITDTAGKEYTWTEAAFENLPSNAKKEIVKVGKKYRFRQVIVARGTENNSPPVIRFDFIETRKGYRLFGIDYHWFKVCCR
jgi:hypothetical protein